MRFCNRFILMLCALSSSPAFAAEPSPFYLFGDFLYWKASAEIKWAYDNDLNTGDQHITYESNDFDYEPGFRVGVGYRKDWDTGVYYTHYSTSFSDSASGNLKSGFMGGTVALVSVPGPHFYHDGQFKMDIDFNMFDWYLGKRFDITPDLMFHPFIGIEGGWIDQSMRADLQGYYETTEKLQNNFWGVGPKFGLDGSLKVFHRDHFGIEILAGFSAAYLIGEWDFEDVFTDNQPATIEVPLADRDMGAVALQGMLGLGFTYHNLGLALSYEINDWFDQVQIFDDATGGHQNDLVLQGLVLRFSFKGN